LSKLTRSRLFLTAFGLLTSLIGCGGSTKTTTTPPPATNVIAYLHRISGVTYEIKVLKNDGTTNTVSPTGLYISVVLSPDGQTILFSCADCFTQALGYQIGTMNADGSGQTLLGPGIYPQYTPDASKIVYETGSGGAIGVMNADGSNQTSIGNTGEFCFPATNGSLIAVGEYNGNSQGLATMNMDGSNQQIILPSAYMVYPAFSADGTQIIFGYVNSAEATNIFSVDTDGSNLVDLTNSTYNWDPLVVGSTIYFNSTPSSIQNPTVDDDQIYSITTDGSNLTAVTNDTLYDGFRTWNGRCLAP